MEHNFIHLICIIALGLCIGWIIHLNTKLKVDTRSLTDKLNKAEQRAFELDKWSLLQRSRYEELLRELDDKNTKIETLKAQIKNTPDNIDRTFVGFNSIKAVTIYNTLTLHAIDLYRVNPTSRDQMIQNMLMDVMKDDIVKYIDYKTGTETFTGEIPIHGKLRIIPNGYPENTFETF